MSKASNFWDGLTSFINQLANRRNPTTANQVTTTVLRPTELRAIFKTGLGSKIIRLKTGYALDDTIQFTTKDQEQFYNQRLAKAVKRVTKFQLGFGRGIIVIQEPGADLSKPLFASTDLSRAMLKVFSGDIITAMDVNRDLNSRRYLKPNFYAVRGFQVHHSRVIDFTYVEPPELDAPLYQYGGISEFELIYAQLVNDAIVERSSAFIIERNATLFYKIKNFKSQLALGKEAAMMEYFSKMEDARSIFGAGIVDQEDEVAILDQRLTNLADADMITLRRLSMVTGLPVSELVGENVKGLNSSGDNEQDTLNRMIKALQSDYFLDPINELMSKFDQGEIEFKDNQEPSANDRVAFEKTAIENAALLAGLGEDHEAYLQEKGITVASDPFETIFSPDDVEASEGLLETGEADPVKSEPTEQEQLAVDPQSALNGAQVTALLDVVGRVVSGEITKATASAILQTAFPIDAATAERILAEVVQAESVVEDADSDSV